MTGAGIRINADQALAKVQAMIQAARNPERLMRKIGALGVSQTKKHIRQGIPPPTHPYFAELKRRSGMTAKQPLYAMGHLYRTITHEPSPGGVRVGSPLRYAATHQFGSGGVRKFYLYLIPERDSQGRIMRNDYGYALGRMTTRDDFEKAKLAGSGAVIRQLVSINIAPRPFLKPPDAAESEQIIALIEKHLEGEAV